MQLFYFFLTYRFYLLQYFDSCFCFSCESFGEGGTGSKHQVGRGGRWRGSGKNHRRGKYDQNMLYEKFQRKVKRHIYGELLGPTSGKTHTVGELKGLRTAKCPARAMMTIGFSAIDFCSPHRSHGQTVHAQSPLWTLDHACIFGLSLFHRTHAPISPEVSLPLCVFFFSPLLFPS